ncbi:centromere protein J [Plodia interpunctella]|uniref:centromere protein J n=1 Tax=Plodia interpunctella TaxID=58824 RepID=UPI002368B4DB|nr:centromere protein J [Plodia interpunctella]
MDESYSESDVTLSPSQILERLQALRQLQLLQRGKLHKQRLEYQDVSENSSSITEIISHFTNSISYSTFRSLLQTPQGSNEASPRLNTSSLSHKLEERDLVDGVSVLNLSQESEFIINSPNSGKSKISALSKSESIKSQTDSVQNKVKHQKHISLDEMPILSPKKDFEALILEKLQKEKQVDKAKNAPLESLPLPKKSYLKRGQGMARFGLNKNNLVIENTKSLPWRQRYPKSNKNKQINATPKSNNKKNKELPVEIMTSGQKDKLPKIIVNKSDATDSGLKDVNCDKIISHAESKTSESKLTSTEPKHSNVCASPVQPKGLLEWPKGKHPMMQNKGKTWAAILTKEQNDFLMQLKQSSYYKNFASPAKSITSDISCDENLSQVRQERETIEQKMFELLESKVSHESFNMENSFFNRFFRKSKLECSGESTPLVMQKCLANNPALMHIHPELNCSKGSEHSELETCNSEYTDCCSDACSSVSSCCSCRTVEQATNPRQTQQNQVQKNNTKKVSQVKTSQKKVDNSNDCDQTDNVAETDAIKANMAEMNAKLIATSELLKDRLRELEDEIESFRKENTNLTKMREEFDLERQKFYEEKAGYEQKFNEEKILSEYYLAEEKEKLTKQKQMYERYVREIRGRLNKKDKDEVLNLKKEINDLKDEIRLKDAKSTSTIARLRNQLKIMDKEKKDLQAEVEKLKKENRRIQHSNEVTRRLTNLKYLEEINKKLNHMTAKETQSEVDMDNNVKYKAFEIERQSRSRRAVPSTKTGMRPRAKSVPNLNVTSRYAKYFSQRDVVSQAEKNKSSNVENFGTYTYPSDNEDGVCEEDNLNISDSVHEKDISDSENENNLEKLYTERFQSTSPKCNRSSSTNTNSERNSFESNISDPDHFFLRKSASSRDSKSPVSQSNTPYILNGIYSGPSSSKSKSPVSILSHKVNNRMLSNKDLRGSRECIANNSSGPPSRSKSPHSSGQFSSNSFKPVTVVNKAQYRDRLSAVSPEPSTSKTSLSKTNLNPTETLKPDGSKELRFPNGNVKYISADGLYSKFIYYNGDIKENFYNEGRIKYFYAETKTFHTTHADGLEVLEFPDGQVEKRYKDGSSEIRLPNGSVRYFDPKNKHVREEWRFPDGAALTVAADGEQRIVFPNGQLEVHAKDHKRREFPDGTVKLVYNDGTSETRYASGRVRIKNKHGHLIMDSAPG